MIPRRALEVHAVNQHTVSGMARSILITAENAHVRVQKAGIKTAFRFGYVHPEWYVGKC